MEALTKPRATGWTPFIHVPECTMFLLIIFPPWTTHRQRNFLAVRPDQCVLLWVERQVARNRKRGHQLGRRNKRVRGGVGIVTRGCTMDRRSWEVSMALEYVNDASRHVCMAHGTGRSEAPRGSGRVKSVCTVAWD